MTVQARALFVCLVWTASAVLANSADAAGIKEAAAPRLGDVCLTGAVGEKMATLFKERLSGSDARGKIYEETVRAFRTHYDDRHKTYGWNADKTVTEGLWQGEYWGKTMLSAAVVSDMTRDEGLKSWLRERARAFVAEFQQPDGYLSTYANGDFIGGPTTNGTEVFCWNIWGQKYTMWALLELSRVTACPELLTAAQRMADNLLARLDRLGVGIEDTGFFVGLPSMSILRPMLLLYEKTGCERYRAFCRKLVGRWERSDGRAPNLIANAFGDRPYHAWYPHPERWAKAYETMSCLEGLVAYAVLEQDERILTAVRRIVDKLGNAELNAVGGVGYFDHFTNAAACPNATTEPCDVTHWIRVNRSLFLTTGEAGYLDAIEFAFYNAFLAGVYRDGKWGAHSVRSHGTRHRTAPHQVGMQYHQCCIDNMPRTFVDFASTIATRTPDGTLSINLYSPGQAKLGADAVSVEGDYPIGNRAKVTVSLARPGKVRLRLPRWFDAVRVDGTKAAGSWYETTIGSGKRTFDLEFVRSLRIVRPTAQAGAVPRAEGFECVYENPEMKGLARKTPAVRLTYGPLLLAKSLRMGTPREEILSEKTVNGTIGAGSLTPVAAKDVWGAWEVRLVGENEAHTFRVCDFASAADADDPKNAFSIWF